jgi:hypothetical protein
MLREIADEEAPAWDAAGRPDLLVIEVPPGRDGAARCRSLYERAGGLTLDGVPYVLALVAPGGGESAVAAGADNLLTGVDADLDAHLALAEQAIARRRRRAEAEAALRISGVRRLASDSRRSRERPYVGTYAHSSTQAGAPRQTTASTPPIT